jgi:two-component system NtrC family sensor kinase
MMLMYFAPLLLLAAFFHIQYRRLTRESQRAHLEVIAEQQAKTFDLFLRERLANLANVINDPEFPRVGPSEPGLRAFLAELQETSDAFVDLGVVDSRGELEAYVGPVDYPESVNYRNQYWYRELVSGDRESVITEVYLGFRDRPHFTIAVKPRRTTSGRVLRSTLSPEWLSNYLTTLEGASEVQAAVVNREGTLQVTTASSGELLRDSIFVPPSEPGRGTVTDGDAFPVEYAYAWLSETPWALVVMGAPGQGGAGLAGLPSGTFLMMLAFFLLMGVVILTRARFLAGQRLAVQRHEAELSGQLVQAAKLASVGELAAGIAHEINNPLAIIAEEAGLLKDSLDPELAEEDDEPLDLREHVDIIHEAVFRCRDITRKLLTFVRQTDVKLDLHHPHDILDDVLGGLLGNELSISRIEVVRKYDPSVPELLVDGNQLVQVFVNMVKNAMDAMVGGGVLTVSTERRGDRSAIMITDTGCGMTTEQLERAFMPFYTTKAPGKGTGLGLSVSCTIIQNLGGRCFAESTPGKGSTFTVELPHPAM